MNLFSAAHQRSYKALLWLTAALATWSGRAGAASNPQHTNPGSSLPGIYMLLALLGCGALLLGAALLGFLLRRPEDYYDER